MKKIDKIILDETKKNKWIVHGARALNKQVSKKYKRPTRDWDLFSNTPRESSIYLEQTIETILKRDLFDQSEIQLPNNAETVYRIVLKSTGEELVDFMRTPNHENLYTVIGGIRYETLEHAKMMLLKVLSNVSCSKRWDKTRRDLRAIEDFENKLTKRKQIRKEEIPSPFALVSFTPMWG